MSNDRDEAIKKAKDLSASLVCVNTREQAVQWMADACMLLDGLEAFYLAAKAKGAEEENEACAKICENMPSTVSTVYECAEEIRARKGKSC